jgi:hypothetical protein
LSMTVRGKGEHKVEGTKRYHEEGEPDEDHDVHVRELWVH